MASDKGHTRRCTLVASFRLKEKAAETICRALGGEGAVTHTTCKNWYKRSREGDSNLKDRERRGKTRRRCKLRNNSRILEEINCELRREKQEIYLLHRQNTDTWKRVSKCGSENASLEPQHLKGSRLMTGSFIARAHDAGTRGKLRRMKKDWEHNLVAARGTCNLHSRERTWRLRAKAAHQHANCERLLQKSACHSERSGPNAGRCGERSA